LYEKNRLNAFFTNIIDYEGAMANRHGLLHQYAKGGG